MKTKILLFAIAFFICALVSAQIINVPGDFNTIQEGINAASDGDTVLVAENTYFENIRFMGKAITVASNYILDGDSSHIINTIIDGSQATDPDSAATVMFINGEDTTSIINGFTITGGSGVLFMTFVVRAGGGIYSYNAGCKIINNIITENHVVDNDKAGAAGIGSVQGQGVYWVVIRDNYIGYNTALANGLTAFGGGMAIMPNCYIENNLIEHNSCTNTNGATDGGGIELEAFGSTVPITYVNNNIIRNNELDGATYSVGGGIIIDGFSDAEVTNNMIENNTLIAGDGAYGGGIRIVNILGVTNISSNIIATNTLDGAISSWGGGISAALADNISITNNIIEGNLCNSISEQAGGGGINLLRCKKTFIQNNEVNENSIQAGTYAWGGGILLDKAKDIVYLNNNRINGNTSEGIGRGGGISIYNETDSVSYFINSNMIMNNYSDIWGGGLCMRNTYRIFLTNNLFKENESENTGGGIRLFESSGKIDRDNMFYPVIANNNFINNSSNFGGAIYSGHNLEIPIIFNSIFWDNLANEGKDIYNAGTANALVYNNDIDTTMIYSHWTGDNNIFCNPEFDDDTLHLLTISDCVNAGIEHITFEDNTYDCPDTDIDGEERPYLNTMPDIGVDETQFATGEIENNFSERFNLSVYPNPFSQSVNIQIELSEKMNVGLFVTNTKGEMVARITTGVLDLGTHQFEWHANSLPTGIYHLVLRSENEQSVMKIMKWNTSTLE